MTQEHIDTNDVKDSLLSHNLLYSNSYTPLSGLKRLK